MTQAELARELNVSRAYISMVLGGKKKPSKRVAERLINLATSVNQIGRESEARIKAGGSEWESNPPKTLFMPLNGFEAREAHRDPVAPLQCGQI